jgi:hypothetical protein
MSSAATQPRAPRSGRDWAKLIGAVGGIVAMIGGIVTLVFTFLPNAKPQPAPADRHATLGDLVVTPGLTFRQYLQRIDKPTGNLDRKTLSRRGALLEFDVGATGYKGDELRLRWQLYDAAGDKVGEEQATTITPQAASDTIAWQAFLTYAAGRRGPFVGRVELLDPSGVPLARLHTGKLRAPTG